MCGISACLNHTNNSAMTSVVNALTKLQNRGYDSAGICTTSNGKFNFVKSVSDDSNNAIHYIKNNPLANHHCSIAIGHTRWATHGEKTIENAHPHFDASGRFSLIHNGIIENYDQIKSMLVESQNYQFYGQTDTEVAVAYLSYLLSENKTWFDFNESLKGSWAIIALDKFNPEKLYFMRNGSPLIIGFNETNTKAMIVSELSGFDSDISQYCIIGDNDYGYITNKNDKYIIKSQQHYQMISMGKIVMDLTPSPYNHWTQKEIYDQPNAIHNLITERIVDSQLFFPEFNTINFTLVEHIVLLGCGTSYHAAQIGRRYIREFRPDITVDVIDGADFEETDIPKSRNTLLILLSQSGETKDLYRALIIGKQHSLKTIGIINVENSLIAREVDTVLYLRAGRENAVASTKSFTNQVLMLFMLALKINLSLDITQLNYYTMSLKNFPNEFKKIIDQSVNEIPKLLEFFDNQTSCFILGKFGLEWIAKEGSLKIKEISYVHSEGYSSAALKHGPFALLHQNIPVVLLANDDSYFSKIENANSEIRSRKAKVIFITNKLIDNHCTDYLFHINTKSPLFHLLCIVPLQLLAYHLALSKEINPDYPRNLAKVVTVE
ncbi:putative glucosamine--fructose-6-phosphate aminotransferase [Niemeyer virus]|uniref:glutamine--fructose-6-phosphate transaminase (isomerizing) n=1 Tax=Acanthamoeba polyphaga mimivirus Kroon TaxID=3069720 RepID=A0A0G2Y3I0_9VIRU|nr:putative glucosamine--fructose-6-phosphate aminotransferase [Acanthamoeba polyphaga mimivirus]AKI80355.1 putative glucosamine--fructose-6-phosphate aminotransferase [Acanthamoeba polyphaga mimivirus Kroon]ALR84290.1 putative glucosamine--fructose-6-phosphate aminotransferase [Niemeyer virus]